MGSRIFQNTAKVLVAGLWGGPERAIWEELGCWCSLTSGHQATSPLAGPMGQQGEAGPLWAQLETGLQAMCT